MTTSRSRLRVAVSHFAYDVLFALACAVAMPAWGVRLLRDRRQWRWVRERLGKLPATPPGGRPIWVHAVSVGEVKAARPLIARLRERRPDVPIVLTTGTTTGRETAQRAFPGLYVLHAPLDLAFVVRGVVRRLDPRLIVLLELEAWPAFMRAADERGVPQVIVNGRVTESSYRTYRRWKWWLPEFDRFTLVAAQDETHRDRIAGLGVPVDRLRVTGNLKHDLAEAASAERVAELGQELGLGGGQTPVFVAGSTHDGEDEPVLDAWLAAGGAEAARLVLVPRHLERIPAIVRMLKRRHVPFTLRSEVGSRSRAGLLLVDTMGELELLFGLADVVFLGGSLVPVGGHNVLEPAAAGRAQLVGPHVDSCAREAERLERAGALRRVPDAASLGREVAALLADPAERARMGRAAREAVRSLSGAAAATIALLEERGLLDAPGLHRTPE